MTNSMYVYSQGGNMHFLLLYSVYLGNGHRVSPLRISFPNKMPVLQG